MTFAACVLLGPDIYVARLGAKKRDMKLSQSSDCDSNGFNSSASQTGFTKLLSVRTVMKSWFIVAIANFPSKIKIKGNRLSLERHWGSSS